MGRFLRNILSFIVGGFLIGAIGGSILYFILRFFGYELEYWTFVRSSVVGFYIVDATLSLAYWAFKDEPKRIGIYPNIYHPW